jgi:hypothetical protein
LKKVWYLLILLALASSLFVVPGAGQQAVGASGGAITSVATFYATGSDGHIAKYGASYSTVHDAAQGVVGTGNQYSVGQTYYLGTYYIFRGGIFFNTASLPDNAVITSATLRLWGVGNYSATDFNVTIVSGEDLNNPLVAADYGDLRYETASGGSLYTSGWVTGGWNSISLNATGLTWIWKDRTTKFGLRSSRDIGSNTPYQNEYVQIGAYEGGHPAELTVTYTAPTGDDSNNFEVGVEWIVHYDDLPDLGLSDNSAQGFYDALLDAGWHLEFEYEENQAWESDFKRDEPGWNGHDRDVVDSVDIAWFDGHGEPGILIFNVAQDDEYLQSFNYDRVDQWNPLTGPKDEARWGDLDLEWIFLNGCETLKGPGWIGEGSRFKGEIEFGWALNGIHLICGWIDSKASRDDGTAVARWLLGVALERPYPVIEAWFEGLTRSQGFGKKVRVIGESSSYRNECIWGVDPVPPNHPPLPDPTPDDYLYLWDYITGHV